MTYQNPHGTNGTLRQPGRLGLSAGGRPFLSTLPSRTESA